MEYNYNFPEISKKNSMYEPNYQPYRVNTQGTNIVQTIARYPNSKQQTQNSNNNAKSKKRFKPAHYTVVESFAAMLRYNQFKDKIPIVLNAPIHTTKQGFLLFILMRMTIM